ncbi:hypothetical protein GJR96_06355 [Haloferax sp. MBLA0076]|uniref:PGF-CTERM sorting domain-containing protein n=1 Tax=Haloferax litoreum TaxID=2666140 RepID=A0A6A8GHH6_9EURY|nr:MULTISPECIES: BGTF surface domain-containing protein [Haloferax]KAB1193085.1 hypothetical protein Hfx1148_06345 [Haloferax sp. CBA1148]MRX21577.1 hypothetical protein [Haloferax litoreum]
MSSRTGPEFGVFLAVVVLASVLVGGVAVADAADADVTFLTHSENVTVPQSDDATIRGMSNLSAGTTVTVRVRATADTSPKFLKVSDATVGENGDFTARFDFSDIPTESTFTVTVLENGTVVGETSGVVVESTTTDATTTASETTDPDTNTRVPGFGVTVSVLAVAGVSGFAYLARRTI